jgi:hypothetical protein
MALCRRGSHSSDIHGRSSCPSTFSFMSRFEARISTFVFLVVFLTVIDVPALLVLGVWFAAQVIAGQTCLGDAGAGGVAWWSHVGGFVAGMALMPLLSLLFVGRATDEETVQQGTQVPDLVLPLLRN